MKLNSPWYELVRDGKKIYEGRRRMPYTETYKVGDVIEFSHYTDDTLPTFLCQIDAILYYQTFEDALNTLPINEVLPIQDITIEKGVEIYKRFVSLPTQLKDGIVMFNVSRNAPENFSKQQLNHIS
jgi:ASC-1-like (ASCH) protein